MPPTRHAKLAKFADKVSKTQSWSMILGFLLRLSGVLVFRLSTIIMRSDVSVTGYLGMRPPPGMRTIALRDAGPPEQWLTTEQVAAMLGVTRMTVYNWRCAYGLPTIALPKQKRPQILFSLAIVREWARANKHPIVREPVFSQLPTA